MTVEPTLSDKQVLSIYQATRRINLWEGAVRAGKSVGANFSWFHHIRHAPPRGELVMLGRTKETIERNVINVLKDESIYGPLARTVAYTHGANSCTILGRDIPLVGANDVQSEAKVRGMTGYGALVDEVTVLPEATFKQLVARMSVPGAKLFGTTNPDSPHHWLKTGWLDRNDPDVASFHFSIDDNPFLEPSFVTYLKRQYSGLWYRRFILGEWCAAEGAIYDQFDKDRHIVPAGQVPAIEQWIAVGVDYGTSNPFHAVLIGLGTDRRLYVVAEYRYDSRAKFRQLTDTEYSAALRSWLAAVPIPGTLDAVGVHPRYIVVDPSALSFRIQMQRDHTPTHPAVNDVLDGIRTVSALFGNDQLRISEQCPELIAELYGYSWDPKAQKLGEDKPLKVNDHGVDGLRYGLHTTQSAWRNLIRN